MVRFLKKFEITIMQRLLDGAGFPKDFINKIKTMKVKDMDEEERFGVYFLRNDKLLDTRKMSKRISEIQFSDSDGVPILASLNVDEDGELFELDLWKVDFSPILDYGITVPDA